MGVVETRIVSFVLETMVRAGATHAWRLDVGALVALALFGASLAGPVAIALHFDCAAGRAGGPLALEVDAVLWSETLLDAAVARALAVALDLAAMAV